MSDDYRAWLRRVNELPEPDRTAALEWAKARLTRQRAITDYPGPAEFAASIDPKYVLTPGLRVISRELERACTTPDSRLIISVPPQEGKSSLVGVWTVIRLLQRNPDTRIILACYSQGLAEQTASTCRGVIRAHGSGGVDPVLGTPTPDRLGIQLSDEKSAAAHWRVRGYQGGMVAVGVGGTITGRAGDCVLIDDPLRGMEAADSAAEKRKVIAGFQGDLSTRLAPGAPTIVVQTRWAEDDLAGWLIETQRDRWRVVNIPAYSEAGIEDALNRPPGVWLESARRRTVEQWEERRASLVSTTVGRRVWYSLYQGSPMPSEGGLFKKAWFDTHRLSELPALYRRIVAVDPAETGKGDEAGVIAAGVDAAGTVVLTEDWSGYLTSAEWARKAVLLALRDGATELVFEAYSAATTYERVIRAAYRDIAAEAARQPGGAPRVVDDVPLPAVLDPDRPPFRIQPWTGKGNAFVRSTGLRSAVATGRARVVEHRLATLEYQAARWQEGQHQPDRVAAAVIAYDHLAAAGSTSWSPAGQQGWGDLPDGFTG